MLPEPRDPAPEMQTTVIDVSVSCMQLDYLRLLSHCCCSNSLCTPDYCVQTLLWGVTLTKKYHDLIPINHVLVELDCAGATKRMKSPAQIAKKRLNFPQPGLSLTVVCA